MYLRFCLLFLFHTALLTNLTAQSKYWIYLDEKTSVEPSKAWVSTQTLSNRCLLGLDLVQQTDKPVDQSYIKRLREIRVHVLIPSKWLNAVSATLYPEQVAEVLKLDFVRAVVPLRATTYPAFSNERFAYAINNYALKQTNAYALAKNNLTGKNVVIGIIDGNFFQSDRNNALAPVFQEGRLLGTRDFVDPSTKNFFSIGDNPQDIHGSAVWQMIAGFDRETNTQYGVATGASFYLARTDERASESHLEEDRWIAALEWMDSVGVRLVHSSLCYSTDFDDPTKNHTPDEMNGATTAISKAARIAAEEKGIIIVVSAGNAGKINSWRIVKAPADVASVISVGATVESGARAKSSSIGSEKVNFIKPDFVCFSQGGTSLSAPIITGIVGCLLEQDPTLSPEKVKHILAKSGHVHGFANNYIGYGIPDVTKILDVTHALSSDEKNSQTIYTRKKTYTFKKLATNEAIIFHKKNDVIVLQEDIQSVKQGELVVKKMEGAIRTTVILSAGNVKEIFWKRN